MDERSNSREGDEAILSVSDLSVFYGERQAVIDAIFDVPRFTVFALIGMSGSGKTTLLKVLSRLIDHTDDARVIWSMKFNGREIFSSEVDLYLHRRKVIYISQTPHVFDLTVKNNIEITVRQWHPEFSEQELTLRTEDALKSVGLWDRLKDDLSLPALCLSAGEKQRLCLARALALEPEVLLCDEPTAHMDAYSAEKIEEIFDDLRTKTTILVVTHSLQQAARISQKTAFLHHGVVAETGDTSQVFTNPREGRTQDYITGRFG